MMRYRGFLSYSHKDKTAARRLLKRLQTYRMPRSAVSGDSLRLGEFFMDRDSLPVAGNLSDAILAGLSEARTLIVLCSQSSARSKWVQSEIETFRKLNPNGDILAVILSGDPQAKDEKGCFPSALLADGKEPLAADFRKGADGPKLGFLKLAASLSGVRLEALLRRDQTRQRRRVIAVTAGAAVITVSMTTLAAVAFTAQKEAEARRADAEGLVDFMITDLKDRLEPVGRLDVLDGVATQVLDYYNGQAGTLDCAQVARQTRGMQLESQIHISKSDLSSAETSALSALELSHDFQAECQNDPLFAISYGHSAFYVGQTAWAHAVEAKREGDLVKAGPLFQKALERYTEYDQAISPLRSIDGYQNLFTQETADNQTNFGAVYFQLERLDEARRHFETARELIAPLAQPQGFTSTRDLEPDGQQRAALATLANAYGWLADIDELEGDFSTAIENREAEGKLYDALAGSDMSSRDWNHYRSALGSKLAQVRLFRADGQTIAANQVLKELLSEADILVRNEPNNQQWQKFQKIVKSLAAAKLVNANNQGESR